MNSKTAHSSFLQRISSTTFFFLSFGTGLVAGAVSFLIVGIVATILDAAAGILTLFVFVAFLAGFVASVVLLKRARSHNQNNAKVVAPKAGDLEVASQPVGTRPSIQKGSLEEPLTDIQTASQPNVMQNEREPTHSKQDVSGIVMNDICRADVLGRFVQQHKIGFYQKTFQDLIDLGGVGNQPIHNTKIFSIRVPILQLLPFTRNTQWNWSAFFATVFWGAWRGVAYNWWILTGYCMAVFAVDLLLANGIAPSVMSRLATALPGGFVVYGFMGNRLFLAKIIQELSSGTIRHQQTSTKALYLTIAAFVGFSVVNFAIFPSTGSGGNRSRGELPVCDSNASTNSLKQMIVDAPQNKQLNLKVFAIKEAKEINWDPTNQVRRCSAIVYSNAGSLPTFFKIYWIDRAKGEYFFETGLF